MTGMDAIFEVTPGRVRARRRPIAVLLVWAFELFVALLASVPLHAWVKEAWGAHPEGDAVLWSPGGYELMSLVSNDGPQMTIVLRTLFVLLAVYVVGAQVPLGALIAALATGRDDDGRPAPAATSLRAGLASWTPLLGIQVVFGAISGLVLGVGMFASGAVYRALVDRIGDGTSWFVRFVLLALFATVCGVVGVIADFARVEIAREAALSTERRGTFSRMRSGLRAAFGVGARQTVRGFGAWLVRAILSVALLALGAWLSGVVGARGGFVLLLLFVVHQLIAVLRVALRASWLAHALRVVTPQPSPSSEPLGDNRRDSVGSSAGPLVPRDDAG